MIARYTVRSERQFCEQLRYNILFKWFLDLNVEDEPFHPTTFTKNRERLLEAYPYSSQGQAAARVLLKEVVKEARRRRLLSAEHFTVEGTLLEPWSSHVTQKDRGRRSSIDGRTTGHDGYHQSQRRRKRVEEVFGWIKTIGGGDKLRYLGRARNKLWFELTVAAYNLTSLAQLKAAAAQPDSGQATPTAPTGSSEFVSHNRSTEHHPRSQD